MKLSDKELLILIAINLSGVFCGTMMSHYYIFGTAFNLVILLNAIGYLKTKRKEAVHLALVEKAYEDYKLEIKENLCKSVQQ